MAYDPTVSRPQVIAENPDRRLWTYNSEDAAADVSADDYFTDGADLGMRGGDPVILTNPTTEVTVFTFASFA